MYLPRYCRMTLACLETPLFLLFFSLMLVRGIQTRAPLTVVFALLRHVGPTESDQSLAEEGTAIGKEYPEMVRSLSSRFYRACINVLLESLQSCGVVTKNN